MTKKDPRQSTGTLFVGALTLTVVLLFPWIPCPAAECASVYQTRMRYAGLPGLTSEQAASIRRYAVTDYCPRCTRFRRVSVGGFLLDWIDQNTGSRRA